MIFSRSIRYLGQCSYNTLVKWIRSWTCHEILSVCRGRFRYLQQSVLPRCFKLFSRGSFKLAAQALCITMVWLKSASEKIDSCLDTIWLAFCKLCGSQSELSLLHCVYKEDCTVKLKSSHQYWSVYWVQIFFVLSNLWCNSESTSHLCMISSAKCLNHVLIEKAW